MKAFILVIAICLNMLSQDMPEQSHKLLQSIEDVAMKIGHGPNHHYVFVDPNCPKSRAYITILNERTKLHRYNSYYIFLFELPRFDSDELIRYIYQSSEPLALLKTVMVEEDILLIDEFIPTSQTNQTVTRIEEVAKTFHMKRRPYILSFEKDSPYCTVSEGTAPCMEE